MSGHECSDFGSVAYGNNLCLQPAGTVYEGLVTYRDGRVATLADSAAVEGRNVELNASMQGAEIGNCAAQGLSISFSPVQNVFEGQDVSWSSGHLSAVYRSLGQSPGQSGNAFFCANAEDARRLVVNSAASYRPTLNAAIVSLTEAGGRYTELDALHRRALLESLCTAAGVPNPSSTWDSVLEGLKYVGGLLGVGLVFGLFAPWLSKTFIDKKGPPNDGPGGGSGGRGEGVLGRGSSGAREVTLVEGGESVDVEPVNQASRTTFFAGLAAGCFLLAAGLMADDATVVGVVDDPLAGAAATIGVIALGIDRL